MIKGFSEETQPLTEYERKVILPIILEGLKTKIGKANAVTNKYIISRLRDSYKIDAARLRKIINHTSYKRPSTGTYSNFRRLFLSYDRKRTFGIRRKPERT